MIAAGGAWNLARVRAQAPAAAAAPVAPAPGPAADNKSVVIPPEPAPAVVAADGYKAPARSPERARGWADLAGKIVAEGGAAIVLDTCKKADADAPRGYDVPDVDDEDLQKVREEAGEGIREKFGDANVPWWAGMALAFGNMYLTVRRQRVPRGAPVSSLPGVAEHDHDHDKRPADVGGFRLPPPKSSS